MTAEMVNTVTGEVLPVPTVDSHEGYSWDDLEQRWVPTSADLVPFVASAIEDASDPAVYVELALARAKSWIADALEHGDINQIVEIKSQAEAIRSYTAQKNLGKDVELSALEIMRRAERGIGLAVRKGQERGEILRAKEHNRTVNQHGVGGLDPDRVKTSPKAYFGGNSTLSETYAITDGVSDEQFDQAIAEAKAEKDMSRANVIRKVKGDASPKPKGTRHELLNRSRRFNSTQVVENTIRSLEGIGIPIGLIAWADVDLTNAEEWLSSLDESLKALRSLRNNLSKELNHV